MWTESHNWKQLEEILWLKPLMTLIWWLIYIAKRHNLLKVFNIWNRKPMQNKEQRLNTSVLQQKMWKRFWERKSIPTINLWDKDMVLYRKVQYQQVTYVRLEPEVEKYNWNMLHLETSVDVMIFFYLCQTFKCLDKILLYIYIYTPIYIYLYTYTYICIYSASGYST